MDAERETRQGQKGKREAQHEMRQGEGKHIRCGIKRPAADTPAPIAVDAQVAPQVADPSDATQRRDDGGRFASNENGKRPREWFDEVEHCAKAMNLDASPDAHKHFLELCVNAQQRMGAMHEDRSKFEADALKKAGTWKDDGKK